MVYELCLRKSVDNSSIFFADIYYANETTVLLPILCVWKYFVPEKLCNVARALWKPKRSLIWYFLSPILKNYYINIYTAITLFIKVMHEFKLNIASEFAQTNISIFY